MDKHTEAMTAADVQAALARIAATLGGGAHVSIVLTAEVGGSLTRPYWNLSANPHGICSRRDERIFKGATWPEVFEAAEEWAATYAPKRDEALIRRLALDIIDLTDEHGRCTEALLCGRGHSRADIAAHHEAACQRASAMSGNAPFSVVMGGGA